MLQAMCLQNIPLLDFFFFLFFVCLCLGCFSFGHHESTVCVQNNTMSTNSQTSEL